MEEHLSQSDNPLGTPFSIQTTDPLQVLPNPINQEKRLQRLKAAQLAAQHKVDIELIKGRVAKRIRFEDRNVTRLPSAATNPAVRKGQIVGPPGAEV